MPNYAYSCSALTGGGTGALDAINGSQLTDGDVAIVVTSTAQLYVFRLNATSARSEASPTVIAPDTNAGDKRWELCGVKFG
jgi:hypothetical protein